MSSGKKNNLKKCCSEPQFGLLGNLEVDKPVGDYYKRREDEKEEIKTGNF